MSLVPGTKLAEYEILGAIGAGGMGDVYRARDTKLGREVAIKVLPEGFAQDKERLARFHREAHLLASLNHPNIATIHGFEESDGQQFLVMELVEGETLAERLVRGPMLADEALSVFEQIAEGLEAAHDKGVIHRDLKPANIKIAPDGKPKILDFGLAKALTEEGPADDSSQSPTLTKGTALGAIMGTAPYMSPEQARGKAVDKRTDIWAFGCSLYEALTGKSVFGGETVSDTIAAVLKQEPHWEKLPPATPAIIQRLLRRCLQKDQSQRMRDVWEARIEIRQAIDEPKLSRQEETLASKSNTFIILGALVLVLIGTLLGAWIWSRLEPPSVDNAVSTSVTRSAIELPPEAPLALGGPVPQNGFELLTLALSPDGTKLVYVGSSSEGRQLYVRALDSFEVEPISDTDGAIFPFFSPDGLWVGPWCKPFPMRFMLRPDIFSTPVKAPCLPSLWMRAALN